MLVAGAAIVQPASMQPMEHPQQRSQGCDDGALPAASSQIQRPPRPSRERMGAAGDDGANVSVGTRADEESVTDRAIGWMREVNTGVLKLPEMP